LLRLRSPAGADAPATSGTLSRTGLAAGTAQLDNCIASLCATDTGTAAAPVP